MGRIINTVTMCALVFLAFTCTPGHIVSELDMIFIEGGDMKLGNGSNQWPFHEVTLSSYYISAYEITNEQVCNVFNWAKNKGYIDISPTSIKKIPYFQWELVDLDNDDCQIVDDGGLLTPKKGKERYPVVQISWYGAVAFCNFLSEKEGRTPSYDLETWDLDVSKDGYYLPHADEWEYAARGGVKRRDTFYAGSDMIDDVAWHRGNSAGTPHPIGLKKANELGIYDLSGNVWEYCTEKIGLYYTFQNGDSDPIEINGGLRIYRGGSYNTDRCQVNSYVCSVNQPDYCWCFSDIGFRVVCKTN
jgi:sulfatase modifying factor 1